MRRAFLLVVAASATLLVYGSASAAPAAKTVEIKGGQQFVPDVSFTDTQHFDKKQISVHQGQTVVWHNHTDEAHTISVVAPGDVPKTVQQVLNCQSGPCAPFFGHAPNGLDQSGNPVPPVVGFLDNFQAGSGNPKFDSPGDSLLVPPSGATFQTTGAPVTDTVSAVISAAPGSTLRYMCAIHPWMQGTIKVLENQERED